MKAKLITSLILSCHLFVSPTVLALETSTLQDTNNSVSSDEKQQPNDGRSEGTDLISKLGSRGGGSRSSGGGGGRNINLNRDRSGSNRINRPSASNRSGQRTVDRSGLQQRAQNVDRNQVRERAQNVDRSQLQERARNVDQDQVRERAQNVDRSQLQERARNVDRDDINNRLQNTNIDRENVRNRLENTNVNLDNDRNYSNRIDRDNIGNRVRIGDNNIIVNPRGYGNWGWHGGVAWDVDDDYWGGGFWGAFAAGAVTGLVTGAAIDSINDNNNPDTVVYNNTEYVVVQNDSPGYQLLSDYGLTQTACTAGNIVVIYGPSNSQICAIPNSSVPAGVYTVNMTTLTLIPQ